MTSPAVEPVEEDSPVAEVIALILAGYAATRAARGLAHLVRVPPRVALSLLAIIPLDVLRLRMTYAYQPPTSPISVSMRAESRYLATFVINSLRRINKSDRPPAETLNNELSYWDQYVNAAQNRQEVAQRVEVAAGTHGALLGWHAQLDNLTSPECRAAHGKNFDALRQPAIGYPGAAHPTCRCRPGAPWLSGVLLEVE